MDWGSGGMGKGMVWSGRGRDCGKRKSLKTKTIVIENKQIGKLLGHQFSACLFTCGRCCNCCLASELIGFTRIGPDISLAVVHDRVNALPTPVYGNCVAWHSCVCINFGCCTRRLLFLFILAAAITVLDTSVSGVVDTSSIWERCKWWWWR